MTTHKQVKVFNEYSSDAEKLCNEFLMTLPESMIVSVTSFHNTILGGVVFVVVYYT